MKTLKKVSCQSYHGSKQIMQGHAACNSGRLSTSFNQADNNGGDSFMKRAPKVLT